MEILKVEHVTKRFARHTALDDVSLTIPKGSVYGLLGPNGAGKTTLIRIINRITAPDEGKVIFDGCEIQPQDGQWTFTHGSRPRASGQCLPGVAEAVSKQMPAPQSGPVTFARPFNASQIIRSPQVAWKRIAPNHWRGTLTGAGGSAMRMEWDVRVTSPARMEGDSIVRVSVPSACTLSTPFTFVRQ